jgi:hypothetical protein
MQDTIEYHYDRARTLALFQVEKLARKILRENKNLTCFIMGMGIATFKSGNNQESLGLNERPYFKPLDDFMNKWDDIFHLTGTPMWLTADGTKGLPW